MTVNLCTYVLSGVLLVAVNRLVRLARKPFGSTSHEDVRSSMNSIVAELQREGEVLTGDPTKNAYHIQFADPLTRAGDVKPACGDAPYATVITVRLPCDVACDAY